MLSIFLSFRRLMEKLGWWKNPTDKKIQEITDNIKKCEEKLKAQQDKLKDLKRTIEDTQEEILLKEKERDSQTGKIREITEMEILSLFKTFESTSGMRDLIFRNISSLQTVISKYKEYRTALESDLDSDQLETLTMDLLDNVKELQLQDRELKRLENVGYSSAETEQAVDLNAKLAQLHGETAPVTPQKTPEPVLPQTQAPKKIEMPSNEEVSALEAQLQALHNEIAPEQKKEQPVESKPEQLEE